MSYEERKKSHINLALKDKNQARFTELSRVHLIHNPLPECQLEDVDISTCIAGQKRKTPFFVSGMTGGFNEALPINLRLAQLCQKQGWMMGLGSQRKWLDSPHETKEWSAIKEQYPDLCLFGNLGLSQLIQTPIEKVEELVHISQVSFMVVHTNPLQECLQPEGTPQFKGGIKVLKDLARHLSVPVIIKETGCGFSLDAFKKVRGLGLYAVDVSGYGGTHWGRIEGDRIEASSFKKEAAITFKDWGNSTLQSLLSAAKCRRKDYKIWASGGIQNGLDAARCLALGAEAVGFGSLILKVALLGESELEKQMRLLEYELKMALFCTGSVSVLDLKNKYTLK